MKSAEAQEAQLRPEAGSLEARMVAETGLMPEAGLTGATMQDETQL